MAKAEMRRTKDAVALLGKRVRVWYKSLREWKVASVSAVIMEPEPGSPVYFQVTCEGRFNAHYYRAEELRPLKGPAPTHRS